MFDIDNAKDKVSELESMMHAPSFWDNPQEAQRISKEKSQLEKKINKWNKAEMALEDIDILVELAEEEGDDSLFKDIRDNINNLRNTFTSIEVETLLSGDVDLNNAIISIHPGAGGTESQDWAEMLMRLYLRWAERHGFKVEILDHQSGDEAGIKDVTFSVIGDYAYGYLKAESGIHRLVRISPFDSNKRRHTSFASVFIYPEIEDDLTVEINEDDLRIDTFRASGAGGQHVNKTSSAIRITHIPTGIVVQCQNERSQHKNKATAMKILRSRLYEVKKIEQEKKMEGLSPEKKDIAWGSQIRSYVMQPYQMIKDHRTDVETGNVTAVLDGDIDMFINAYLTAQLKPNLTPS
ncbi:MAG: peptide chain release factor 2 [Nitrospirae bacterium]|nr:peptide chain release factor 2 [Nitrospirota bacterium]